MSEYTPGPWVKDPTPNKDQEQHGMGGERIFKVVAGRGGLVADVSGFDTVSAEHNARLIAAAPELLEACQSVRAMLDWLTTDEYALGDDAPERDRLDAAIKKATE